MGQGMLRLQLQSRVWLVVCCSVRVLFCCVLWWRFTCFCYNCSSLVQCVCWRVCAVCCFAGSVCRLAAGSCERCWLWRFCYRGGCTRVCFVFCFVGSCWCCWLGFVLESLYVGAAKSKVSLLQDILLIRLFFSVVLIVCLVGGLTSG